MRLRRVRQVIIGAGAVALSGVAALSLSPSWADTHDRVAADPLPVAAPAAAAGRIVGGYWSGEDVESKVSDITSQAPQYNLVYTAFVNVHRDETVPAYYPPAYEPPEQLQADIAASQRNGTRWLLSVGGANAGIKLLTSADADQLVSVLEPLIAKYHFDGVDFDIECPDKTAGCWKPDLLTSVAKRLKGSHGPSFLISAAPGPDLEQYRTWGGQMGDDLDFFGYQFYDDLTLKNAQTLRDAVSRRVLEALAKGIAPCKILVGAVTHPGYADGGNTVSAYVDAFDDANKAVASYLDQHPEAQALGRRCARPGLGGVFVWNVNLDKLDGWTFAKGMGEAMRRG